MKNKLQEAYGIINEWGLNEDDFIAQKVQYYMSGGEADDNSIELHKYFQVQLKIIVDLGLREAKNLLGEQEVDHEKDV
jgi:hypothetical protein